MHILRLSAHFAGYNRDHLGSVRDAVNAKTGARIAAYDFDPYGGTVRGVASVRPEFLYAGMQYLPEGVLYLTQYRAYNPAIGRWLNRDPIEEDGGINLYAYVGGNPVNFVDSLGLQPSAPVTDPTTGAKVGRFIVDSAGNTMIEPQGGSTSDYPKGSGSVDTHTYYQNGSNYQRLNPNGHSNNPTPHGHGHQQGTGPGMKGQGASLDPSGKVVKPNTPSAHWPINSRICPKIPGILMFPRLIIDAIEYNKTKQSGCEEPYCS